MSLWSSCKRWLGLHPVRRRPIMRRVVILALEPLEDRCVPAITFTQFTNGITANSGPNSITTGPDNNLWFTEYGGSKIGVMNTSGVLLNEFATTTDNSHPLSIVLGPDGNLWFTEVTGGSNDDGAIGMITPQGVVTEYSAGLPAGSAPAGICVGPDGNLWFTESGSNEIGAITTTGVITNFSTGISPNAGLRGITAGPDGNLWFIEGNGNRIGRITPQGTVTEYSYGLSPGANLNSITAGPDGNLWFTETDANNIGSITTAGVITEHQISMSLSTGPLGLTTGPDGNLWFAETNASAIGRLSGVQASTTTSLTTSDATPVYGKTIILTATVTAPLRGASASSTGVVTFYDGTRLIGAAAVSGNLAVIATDELDVGQHNLTADYLGSTNYAPSTSGNVQDLVVAAPTATSVTGTGIPSVYGQVVLFTATVSVTDPNSDAVPTGAVGFYDNGRLLGTAALSGGVAVYSTSALTGGYHTAITAQYLPTADFVASTSPLPTSQFVNAATTSTALTTSNWLMASYGQPLTLTATVTDTNSTPAPTGYVSFYDGLTLLGTSALSGGVAALTTATLTAGTHTDLNAVYMPTANFQGSSTILPGSVSISAAGTTIALTTSDNSVTVGSLVTYTATITNWASAATPTGYVSFYDNGNLIGVSTLSGGAAAIAVAPVNAGMHSISATYTPADNNFIGTSTISPLAQQFNPGPAAELLFGQQPAFTFVNVTFPLPVTVIVADQFGNQVNSTVKVTLGIGSNPGASGLLGARTITAVNGVATFNSSNSNLRLTRPGSGYTLVASSSGLTRAISNAFNVSAANHFGITVSTKKIVAGVPFNITISALTAVGRVDPNYVGMMQITSSDPTLPIVVSSYTFTAADAGRHTFTGVVLNMPPSVKLTVVDLQRPQVNHSQVVTITAPAGTLVLQAAKLTTKSPLTLLD